MVRKAGIWAARLGLGPEHWDSGLEVEIWASRLGIGPKGWDSGLETRRGGTDKEGEGENSPYV